MDCLIYANLLKATTPVNKHLIQVPQKCGCNFLTHPVRVQVSNMPPPWGKCGDAELKYLSVYSVSTCTTECETDYVYQHCGCIDISMPSGNGQPLIVFIYLFKINDRRTWGQLILSEYTKIHEYTQYGNVQRETHKTDIKRKYNTKQHTFQTEKEA